MNLVKCKKLIESVGVKSWREAGVNVVKLGDSWLGSNDFARLEVYEKDKQLKFVSSARKMKIPCGGIELQNGVIIKYNVI